MESDSLIAYRIRNWDKLFENAESRKLKSTSIRFVMTPNKHDGKGFGRIAVHKKSIEIFTAWILITQIASKLPERGLLVDDSGPLTAEDMAFKSRYPKAIFELALEFLSSSLIAWLEKIECPEFIVSSGRSSQQIPCRPEMSQEIPIILDRREGKGIEGNDKQLSDKSDGQEIPYKEIVNLFNEVTKTFPKLQKLTKARKMLIRARWLEYSEIDSFKQLFEKAEQSDFLTGRDGNWPNCTIDNLLATKIFTKCIEGGYDNNNKSGGFSERANRNTTSNQAVDHGAYEKLVIRAKPNG